MALSALTAQLPSHTGALPDLFQRGDGAPGRTDDASTAPRSTGDSTARDEPRMAASRPGDDTARLLARRAALGPLTYGRSMLAAHTPDSAPIGMRGAHLDVRG